MGLLDNAKDALGKAEELAKKNSDKIKDGLDKAGDVISDKTGGKYDDKIDKVTDTIVKKLDEK